MQIIFCTWVYLARCVLDDKRKILVERGMKWRRPTLKGKFIEFFLSRNFSSFFFFNHVSFFFFSFILFRHHYLFLFYKNKFYTNNRSQQQKQYSLHILSSTIAILLVIYLFFHDLFNFFSVCMCEVNYGGFV